MENQPKLNSSKEVIAWLAERFPHCFSAEGEARPLKIGIFQDLVDNIPGDISLSKTQLRSALRHYTSSWRYLHGVKAGATRVDLQGNPCGELEEQHVEHARKQLEEAKARVQAQRALVQAKKREVQQAQEGESRPRKAASEGQKASKPRHKPARPAAERKPAETKSYQPVTELSALKIGQPIKVMAGKSAMNATILEITKDGVRVELASGLAMIVRTEHLQF